LQRSIDDLERYVATSARGFFGRRFHQISISWLSLGERCEAYLLDVIITESAAILQLLSGEDQSLLVRRDAFLVLDLGLDIVNSIGRLHLKGDSLAREGLYEAINCGNFCQLLILRFHIVSFIPCGDYFFFVWDFGSVEVSARLVKTG